MTDDPALLRNYGIAILTIREALGMPPRSSCADIVAKVRENVAALEHFEALQREAACVAECREILNSAEASKREPCSRCGGGGWVPSQTEADTDPCPECEGGFAK